MPAQIWTVAILAAVACGSASAQHFQDVVRIGSHAYIRTQQPIDDLGAPQAGIPGGVAIDAADGRCTAIFDWYDGEFVAVYGRTFDEWGQPLGPSAVVAEWSQAGSDAEVRRYSVGYSVMWVLNASRATAMLDLGTPRVAVTELFPRWYGDGLGLASQPGAWAFVTSGTNEAQLRRHILLRVLDEQYVPLTPILTLQDNGSGALRDATIVAIPELRYLVGYIEARPNPLFYLQPVAADYSLPSRALVSGDSVESSYLKALADGDALCIYARRSPLTGVFAQRVSTAGQAVGPRIDLQEPTMRDHYAAATSDGRMAIGQYIPPEDASPWVRLYSSDGAALGPRFHYVIPVGASRTLAGVYRAMSYDDDGTLWIAWGSVPDWFHLTQLKPFDPGDMNYDRVVDNGDIDAFVLALTAPEVYESLYPGVPYRFIGDMNEDGAFDNGDIDGFVAALLE